MAYYNNGNFANSIPPVTRNLLIINGIIWLACSLSGKMMAHTVVDVLGLHYFQSRSFYLYQLITFMFTHEEFSHLFFNMFALFMFGGIIERTWGPKRFLTYYIVTGIGSGLIQLLVLFLQIQHVQSGMSAEMIHEISVNGADLLHRNRNYIDGAMGNLNILINSGTIGASGAVFGLLLAFGMLFPNAPIYLMFIPIPVKAKYMVIGYGLLEFFFGIANRASDHVAHFAHLGGMLFGIFMILYWKKKRFDRGNEFY